jgi:phosphoribosylformylglycinamidine synthase
MGIVEDAAHVTGSTIRSSESVLFLLGHPSRDLGGSVLTRILAMPNLRVPKPDLRRNLALYRELHTLIRTGNILSAHDVSEGGLAVALAEMAFGEKADVRIDANLDAVDLFNEAPGQIVIEVTPEVAQAVESRFATHGVKRLGVTASGRGRLKIGSAVDEEIATLKAIWKAPLAAHY